MFEFHTDKKRYFEMQHAVTREYIIPYLNGHFSARKKQDILEIGCGEAGVLKAFTDLGHQCVGIDLVKQRIQLARQFMQEEVQSGKIRFISKNIYEIEPERDLSTHFDLILLKDVIEHIPEQEKFIPVLERFLKPGGKIFFGFPPWQMPFGGHQQICASRWLSKLPYFHLLPMPVYKAVLSTFGESKSRIQELAEVKETGISIERFERIIDRSNFDILKKRLFLVNPIYHYKFNLQVRTQLAGIAALPFIRNFFTTAAYYLIGKK